MLTNLKHARRRDDRDGGQKLCAADVHDVALPVVAARDFFSSCALHDIVRAK
jgi:hypothetical protein